MVTRRSHCWHLLTVGLVVLAAPVVARASGDAAVVSERPTPAAWEQWQPPKDDLDGRLRATVSIWQARQTISDLLRGLSEQTGVPLATTADLSGCEATGYVNQHPLRAAMIALARAFGGYWVYRRGQTPEARTYCLVPSEPLPASVVEWSEAKAGARLRETAALWRSRREKQLEQYRSALPLSPDELLSAHEQDEPWLCAHLLSPVSRPVIQEIAALSPNDLEELLSAGRLARPMRSFDAAFAQHVARWIKGAWGPPSVAQPLPDPDGLARFGNPEEAWGNGIVELYWFEDALQFSVKLPDGSECSSHVMGPGPSGLLSGRVELARLGYREATEEYRQAAVKEAQAWAQTRKQTLGVASRTVAPATPQPDLSDPRVKRRLNLEALPRKQRLDAASLFEQAARQCQLGVLSVYLPPDRCTILWPDAPEKEVLGSLLGAVRSARKEAWTWGFLGDLLVGADRDYWIIAHSPEPTQVIAKWTAKFVPGASVDMEDLAASLASLDGLQVVRLSQAVPALMDYPLAGLRLYGTLSTSQRQGLGEGVRVQDLTPDQAQGVWVFAKQSHPWLRREDLNQAVLRSIPRTLSTGSEGLSLIVDYHLPDSPNDRDILLTTPLQIHVPEQRAGED